MGRAYLANQVDRAYIYPQLQRGGGHQRPQLARLEALLRVQTLVSRETAVVGRHLALSQPAREMKGESLRQAPGVDEHQGGALFLDQLAYPVVYLFPGLVGADRRQGGPRELHRQLQVALVSLVDDAAARQPRRVEMSRAHEKAGQLLDRALGGGKADTGGPRPREGVQAFQAQREMRASLVPGHGVNLIHDNGLDRLEHGSPAGGSEHDVQRFGGSHQNMGRLARHALALGRGGIAGPHQHSDLRTGLARLLQNLADSLQGLGQVLLYVVAQGLQWRDVEHLGLVG